MNNLYFMKSLLLSVLLIPIALLAQHNTEKKIYLDSLWNETKEGNHKYYRIINSDSTTNELYHIKDYYESGVLQMEGNSKTEDGYGKEGEFVFYYKNGNKKNKTNYYKSRLLGKDEKWYESGLKKSEGDYFESKDGFSSTYKTKNFWNPEGKQIVSNGNGYYEDNTEDGFESGEIKNGLKEGIWTGTYNKKLHYTEEYNKGEIISGVSKDEHNKEYKYTMLEVRPEPIKGIKDFYKHIGKNFKVPRVYESMKGKIITTFVIEKDGEIVELKNIKSVFEILDQEAIRVISSYGKWKPGLQRGQNVKVLYSIPISLSGIK